jgi:hypothetical protein
MGLFNPRVRPPCTECRTRLVCNAYTFDLSDRQEYGPGYRWFVRLNSRPRNALLCDLPFSDIDVQRRIVCR